VRDVTDLETFKADLLRWLAICHDNDRDVYVKYAALIRIFQAFENFVQAWDDEVYEKLAPVLREHSKKLANVINGRQAFKPAPRKGKRPPSAEDLQAQSRAALYMDLRVPEIGKEEAAKEASRKFREFGFSAESVNYWRDQATYGDETPWSALFQHNLQIVTAQHPNSPQKQAKALLVHKRPPRR
jgi:hypothetical protein